VNPWLDSMGEGDLIPYLIALAGALVAVGSVLWAARQRKVAERNFHSASRLKNEFVSMVSHELRTPLTSIAGFAEALRDTDAGLSAAERQEFLTIICREAEHLSTIVEDILVVPRIEAGRLDLAPLVMDISEVVEELVPTVFPPGHDRDIQVYVPAGVKVYADPKRVGQIVRNLLANAGTHGGKSIGVEGTYIGTHYQLTVSDNGSGVPTERRAAIFQQFEQGTTGDSRDNPGMGLGLPIARKLAQQMGGELWFEPRFPVGSRFCVSFPLSVTHVGAMNRAMVASAVDTSGLSWG
jgi:signal transduction histidine kinase